MAILPPLNALRAFEAAARHLSFKKAAEELNVTPAAVSHQIKTLEEFVGQPLFRRLTRALLLTDAGQRALPFLRDGFENLAAAAGHMPARHGRTAQVSGAIAGAAAWLGPIDTAPTGRLAGVPAPMCASYRCAKSHGAA